MNFGYLIVVAKHDTIDYDQLAYALALSIKNTQRPGFDKVALVIDDKSRLDRFKSTWVFDHVIEWSQETFWDGRAWMDQLSPFENTVCLDADMLFFRDYSHWIEYFIENCELHIPNKAFTYRGHEVRADFYRKAFTKNDLPNLYSFYTFFKKDSDLVTNFFNLVRIITKNQNEFKNLYLEKYRPKIVGTDEAFALASKILDISDVVTHPVDFPRVVHFKGNVQDWPWPADKASDHVGFYFNSKAELKLGNYQQLDIVHYVEKDKITEEVISVLEEKAWKK
jgi:hypothetical protein